MGPYTRAAIRMVTAFAPTLTVWVWAVGAWILWVGRDEAWLIGGVIVLTIPLLVEYFQRKQAALDEARNHER